MPSLFSSLALRTLRTLVQRPTTSAAAIKPTSSAPRFQPILRTPAAAQAFAFASAKPSTIRQFSTSPFRQATFNQVRRGCRTSQAARRSRSPALIDRSQMKGVCMKTGITKPKKPNSGERKTARVRLSSGKVVTAYIPGEGMSTSCHLRSLAGSCWVELW
jgi:small subunit ribosomal protein S12